MKKQNDNYNKTFIFLPKIDIKEGDEVKNVFPGRQNIHFVKNYTKNSKQESFLSNSMNFTLAAIHIPKKDKEVNREVSSTNNNNNHNPNNEYEKSSYFGSDLDRYDTEKSNIFSIDFEKL